MSRRRRCILSLAAALEAVAAGQTPSLVASREHPAIRYSTRETTDPVAALNRAIQSGQLQLSFDGSRGYLASILKALGVPLESQTLVFSETSFQPEHINPRNPRALYFNDNVAVGWVNGSEVLEVAAHDPRQGVIFYSFDQKEAPRPRFRRDEWACSAMRRHSRVAFQDCSL